MEAAGWKLRGDLEVEDDDGPDTITESHTVSFWAERDGLMLSFSDFSWPDRPSYDSDGAASFELYRHEPAGVRLATWAGGVLGGIVFVLVGWWVRRRVRDQPGRRVLVRVLGWIAFAGLLPAALFCVSAIAAGTEPIEPWWMGLIYLGLGPALISALATVVLLTVAAWPRRFPPWITAHPRVVAVGLVAVLAVAITGITLRQRPQPWAGAEACRPAGLPAEPPAADTRLSREAVVYVTQESTPEQRNYIDAAIFRVMAAGPGNFYYDPLSPEFRRAYCGRAPLDPKIGPTLPYLYEVGLSSPGAFPALVNEVQGMPGVVGVRHALPD